MIKIIGKIELPEKEYDSSSDCCEHCGCETDSSFGDSRYVLKVRDEVYGTWSKEMVCWSCYCMEVENQIFNR